MGTADGTHGPRATPGTDGAAERGGDPYAVRAAVARAAMVRAITMAGGLADARWRAAFEEVPRHLFVPHYYVGATGGYERLSGTDPDPRRRERWLAGAYADTALATRVRGGALVSSSSQPSLMARMLHELRVEDDSAVLEIGAGTGYNAALLAHRLGDGLVTTVDLDEDITAAAREHLRAAGYRPTVVTGDGARGCPSRAPFDRIIATCALARVPTDWLAQCRPGGLVLAPLSTGLIALRVGDATSASGRFLTTSAYFVPLRSRGAGEDGGGGRGGVNEDGGGGGGGGGGDGDGGGGVADAERGDGPGTREERLPPEASTSDLFGFMWGLCGDALEPEAAYDLWRRQGRPRRERFGVTVEGNRQWAWLDAPDGPCRWPLRSGAGAGGGDGPGPGPGAESGPGPGG